jgi:ferric-dicitrate binding protein FerR (iron transport regulator)
MIHQEHELHRRRRTRNLAVLAALAGFALLLFTVTIVKLGENAGNPWG